MMAARHGAATHALGVGIGVHSGLTTFGEFGTVHKDFTAVGTVVNLAARLQAAAAAGEILVSREVMEKMDGTSESESCGTRDCALKGFANPIIAFLM
jgi:adenylate cyclase